MIEEHFTLRQIEDYAARRLSPAKIPALHEHVESCPSCREMLVTVIGGTEHITEKEAVDYVAGLLAPHEHARMAGHIEACGPCAAMVADLEEFRRTFPAPMQPRLRTTTWLLPIAASLLLVGAVSGWFALRLHRTGINVVAQLRDADGTLELNASGGLMAKTPLSPGDAELLKTTLRSGHLPEGPPPLLTEPREMLRSSSAADAPVLRILEPDGVRVLSDRPEFRWSPIDRASSYRVIVVDEDLNEIARSGALRDPVWVPDTQLPRQRPLLWQVEAIRNGVRITAPIPPEPSPRFEIVSAEAAQRIAAAQAGKPPSHLLLAILYSQAGLNKEADAEVRAIAALNPGSTLAASLRNSLPAHP